MPLPKTHKEYIKDKKNMFQIDGVNDIHRMFCRYNRNQCRINFSENQRKNIGNNKQEEWSSFGKLLYGAFGSNYLNRSIPFVYRSGHSFYLSKPWLESTH